MAQRQNSLTEIYEEVRTSYHAGDSEAFLDVLFRIENSDSVRLSIIDETGQMIYDSDTAQESQNILVTTCSPTGAWSSWSSRRCRQPTPKS